MNDICRILLADDHEIFRAGLKSLIDKEPRLRVVGEAGEGAELLAKLRGAKCDIVVLDLSMPNVDGMEALGQMRGQFPEVKVLVLTMQKDPEHYRQAFSRGASGYVLKDDAYEQLVLAIKMVMKGKRFSSPSILSLLRSSQPQACAPADTPSLSILTEREKDVLKMIALGLANKNIAAKLNISIRTVEGHRAHLTRKLGIKTTAGLVKYALAKNIG